MPPTAPAPETDLARLRILLIGAFVVAVLATLFGWHRAGPDVIWSRYALATLLVYGTSFVVLGIVCFMLPAIATWPLSAHLRWLGGFALLHGGKELFEAWQMATPAPHADLAWLMALWLLASFLPLLEFARRLWRDDAPPQAAVRRRMVSPWLYGWLALLAAALALAFGALPAIHVAARYLVVLPGAAFTSLWLWRRSEAVDGGRAAAMVAAIAIAAYALLAGTVVESDIGAPAWLVTFDAVAGVPVEVLRALCAALATLAVSRLVMIHLARVALAAGRNAAELAQRVEQQTRANALAQKALASAQDAICISDREGRLTYVNASFLSMLGYRDAAEVLGTEGRERWLAPSLAREVTDALEREGHWQGELEAPRSDGRTVPVRVAVDQVRDTGGRLVATMATIHDLTEVRRAQREERLQRAFYEAIVEHAGTMVVVLDAQGRIVRFNRACESVSGRSSDEVQGRRPWEVLIPLEQAEAVRQEAFAALSESPRAWSGRYTNEWVAADGTRALIDWYNSVLLDDDGRLAYVVSVGVDITEHRRIENDLLRNKQRLNEAQRIAQVGSWELDLGSGRLAWSHEVFRIFEIDPAHFGASYEAFLAAIHPDDRAEVDTAYTKSLADRAPYRIQHRLRMPDGRIKWVEERCESTFDVDGKPLLSRGTVQDITELKRAEQSLRDTKALLAQAQSLAHLGNWSFDLDSGQAAWSLEEYRLLGYEPDAVEAGRDSFVRAIHPDDRSAVLDAMRRAMGPGGGGEYRLVHRVVVPAGERFVEQRGFTTFDAQGRALRMFGTTMDVTERTLHEAELERHRRQLEVLVQARTGELERQSLRNELILGTAIDGFYSTDSSGRMLDVNAAYCDMLGYTREELLALSLGDVEADESPQETAAHIEAFMARGHDRFDTHHRRKDGSLVAVEISANQVEIGGERFFMAFVRDITERVRAEQSLRAARDEAERANRAKSNFLSGMSHELRTPMNAILGFSQLLQMEPLPPRQLDAVDEIHRAGQHLLALIDDLLDLTRIEAGKLAVVAVPVDLGEVIDEALRIVQPMLATRRLELLNRATAGVGVTADPIRLRQVLVNLLSNAAKYNREGGRISVDVAAAGIGHLRISVSDTGVGIPPEGIDRLFKTFERLGAERSGVEGSGIGLALSKQLAEMMGGRLGVESRIGEGSTFWVELPVAARGAEDGMAPGQRVQPEGAEAPFQVLYIEDNRANLKVVELMFQTRPHWRLLTANTGLEGLDLARSARPDAILLDIHLPGMDGYAVLQTLQSDPHLRSVPVVALSADALPAQVERGLRAGFSGYLPKPLDLQRLMSLMAELAALPRR